MCVNQVVLHAKDASIPLKSSVLKEKQSNNNTPDFFAQWLKKEVNKATPLQRKEWAKAGKQYLKTFAITARMIPVCALTLAGAPTVPLPGNLSNDTISSIITVPIMWLMSVFMPDTALPPASVPKTTPVTTAPPVVHASQQTAVSISQTPSVPHTPSLQSVPGPTPTHGAESFIPTPTIAPGNGPDLTELAQMALMFIIQNGFYILLAVLAATGIMKAFGAHTLAKKVALNTIKGIGILLLSTPAVVLMLYLIMFIMGQFPGFHPPIPVSR